MAEIGELQIHTVYSAEQGARLGVRIRVLGLLNVVVALVWLYVAWQPIGTWIQRTLTFGEVNLWSIAMNDGRPGAGGDAASLALLMNGAGKKSKPAKGGAKAETEEPRPLTPEQVEKLSRVKIGQYVLESAAASWFGVTTIVGALLLVAGVAALTNFSGGARRAGQLLLPLSLIALGVLIWYGWKEYHWYESIMPRWVKPVAGALLVIAAGSLGAIFNRRGVGLQRAGAILVIFSALFSVVAIWAAIRWGQMPSAGVGWRLYSEVFAIQSAYGWFLLLAMIGLK